MLMEFTFVGAACFTLVVDGALKIACDPALNPVGSVYHFTYFDSTRRIGPVYDNKTFENTDLWLITHSHADHLDESGLKVMQKDTVVVTEQKAAGLLRHHGFERLQSLGWGRTFSMELKGYLITVRAVPAYHGSNPVSVVLAGKVNGYLLTVEKDAEKKMVYITGDTVYHPGLVKALRGITADVMIANLGEVRKGKWGGPLTMNPAMLSTLAAELNPARVIPVHTDDFSHYQTAKTEAAAHGFKPAFPGKSQLL